VRGRLDDELGFRFFNWLWWDGRKDLDRVGLLRGRDRWRFVGSRLWSAGGFFYWCFDPRRSCNFRKPTNLSSIHVLAQRDRALALDRTN